jgi:hypothetical protein
MAARFALIPLIFANFFLTGGPLVLAATTREGA